MIIIRAGAVFFILIILIGCGPPAHISRDMGLFVPIDNENSVKFQQNTQLTETADFGLKLLFEKKIKGSPNSPILLGEKILGFNTSRKRFLIYDPATGDKLCRIKKRHGFILNQIITDSLIVLVKKSPLGQIFIQNLFTGKKIQELEIKKISSGPIIIKNILIVGTTYGLIALEFPELNTIWKYDCIGISSVDPIYDNQAVYTACGNGTISAVNLQDGSLIWKTKCGASVVSDLAIGQYLYAGLDDGSVIAINKANGEIVWRSNKGYAVRGKPLEYNNKLYYGCTDGIVYCLSVTDGTHIWNFSTSGIITASPLIYGNAVLIGSHDRYFYSLDSQTGRILNKHKLEGSILFAAVGKDERVYVTCQKNRLYCFERYYGAND